MIVGFLGKKNVGKDTAAKYLIENYGYERRAFFDKAKEAAATAIGISVPMLENFKDGSIYVEVREYGYSAYSTRLASISVREYLQNFGDALRGVFGEDVLIDPVIPFMHPPDFYRRQRIVISDVRMAAEVRRIKELSGVIIRINRPLRNLFDSHASELEQDAIQADFEINNTGTIQDLHKNLDIIMEQIE